MLWHGSVAGAFDLKTIVMESVTSMRRAGEQTMPHVNIESSIHCNFDYPDPSGHDTHIEIRGLS